MTDETKRKKIYKIIEHLNAAVNILRATGLKEFAEDIKTIIRKVNQ